MSITSAEPQHWVPALLGSPLRGGRVRCDLCPFRCELSPGRTGACNVRRHAGSGLETATSTVAVTHLDAVERKPFFHVLPGRTVLTVAGPGCTFRCTYCVNHRLSQYGRDGGLPWAGEPARPAELVRRAVEHGALLGMSYAEPGLAPELTLALADEAGPAGVPLLWKTNGFLTPEAVDLVAPALTAVNVDVKAADNGPHRRLTGAPLRPVLDAVERFLAAGVWVEVSTPLIPGTSADLGQLRRIARLVAGFGTSVPWHLLRFTPDHQLAHEKPTPPAALTAAVVAGREAGLRFVYVERALGDAGRRTDCPACGTALVHRDVWRLRETTMAENRCPACDAAVPGVWGTT
jgi:pyruvate formate lyase activating enzyme